MKDDLQKYLETVCVYQFWVKKQIAKEKFSTEIFCKKYNNLVTNS